MKNEHSRKRFTGKVTVAKDFEFKIFSSLLSDLVAIVVENGFHGELRIALLNDIEKCRIAIRHRDAISLATIASHFETLSILERDRVDKEQEALAFFICQQLGAFMKKFPGKGTDARDSARRSFFAAESECQVFNNENHRALQSLDNVCHELYGNMIQDMRDDIEHLIGAEPDLSRIEAGAKHGPGVASGLLYKKGKCTTYFKWSNLPYTVTRGALPHLRTAIQNDPRWIGALDDWYRGRCNNRYAPINLSDFESRIFKVVDGSRITFVPKSALTERTIAIEPLGNVYLQLGVDRFIRHRLRRWGVDLSSQEVNSQYAKVGSEDGSLATLDLSAASDTISLKICEILLPARWYDLLLDLRSPVGTLDGEKVSFEKLSSMGNGYTFAIETLIFSVVVRHVMRRLGSRGKTAVYGDDIIVPTEVAYQVIDMLQLCGFSINIEKSFIAGPFRESCGSDWYQGQNVRPFFLKKRVQTVMDIFFIHNSLYAMEIKFPWHWDIKFPSTLRLLRRAIPSRYRSCYGPISESLDTHLFSKKKLKGIGQLRKHRYISVTPKVFNRESSFFFRKLMHPLKVHNVHKNGWEKNKQLTTGNVFDITRRGCVSVKITSRCVYL